MIKIDHIDKNPFSRPGEKLIAVKKIVIHYTACPGATAKNIRDYFQNLGKQNPNDNIEDRSASAHYAIDDNETIEIIPPDEVAYHVGALKKNYTELARSLGNRSPNNYSLGIELCHNDITGKFSQYVIGGCLQLTKILLNVYNLEKSDVCMHYDLTGKLCPKYFVENPDQWESFINLL
ncbi:MAG: N-acetylmuramoyl-L-alanine amidase [Leptospiraceae bacterium]|nr:N-acetylmuramoyl-L-alanine amidase [Leptospiraceae bacterium]